MAKDGRKFPRRSRIFSILVIFDHFGDIAKNDQSREKFPSGSGIFSILAIFKMGQFETILAKMVKFDHFLGARQVLV